MQPPRIYRVRVPVLGRLAIVRDNGEAHVASGLLCGTHLAAHYYHNGRLEDILDLGSGVTTVTLVNDMVTAAVTPATNPLAGYLYHDSGTGTTAASDTQTNLVTPAGPTTRATGTLSNAQTADGSNHTAQLLNTGSISYSGSVAVTEWALFSSATRGSGSMADRRTFSVINVSAGDSISFLWTLSLPSNA